MTKLRFKQTGKFVSDTNQERFRFKESAFEHKTIMRREMTKHGFVVREKLRKASTMRLGQGNTIIKEPM